jgi:hypothetical protein
MIHMVHKHLAISLKYCNQILQGLGLVARVPAGGNEFRVIFADDFHLYSFLATEMPNLALIPVLNKNHEVAIYPIKEFHWK